MMEPKESLVGGINVKDMMDYVVMVELMKSEVREYMESMELIKLMKLVKRETIDCYLMKLMEPMKIVGWVKFFH